MHGERKLVGEIERFWNRGLIKLQRSIHPRETKIGSRNREVCEISDKLTERYGPRETNIGSRNREVCGIEGSRNRDSTVLTELAVRTVAFSQNPSCPLFTYSYPGWRHFQYPSENWKYWHLSKNCSFRWVALNFPCSDNIFSFFYVYSFNYPSCFI